MPKIKVTINRLTPNFCMSRYSHNSHKSMPDAKFESGGSSNSGDMTSQNVPLKKGTSHRI